MTAFENAASKSGFSMKLWRGERMCLLGFDVEVPEPDLVGFAIECKAPGESEWKPLRNRIAFSYPTQKASDSVDGSRQYPSTKAPFQKFRWVHFPFEPKAGDYRYRATKLHMPTNDVLKKGTSLELDISLDPVTYHDFVDVGFTRNFASSQAFRDHVAPADPDVVGAKLIPALAEKGLEFHKLAGGPYRWLGFEAYDLLFGFLDAAENDASITLDVFAYDLNEPDVVAKLEKLGHRLRVVIDDSTSKNKAGRLEGHGIASSAESKAASRLRASAGAANVKRTHFRGLQHHKVLIARRNGAPFQVLVGSTNFSFRGIYIQANNVLVFSDSEVAGLYGRVFDAAFADPTKFPTDPLAGKWHLVKPADKPALHFCFSPHASFDLSLSPVRGAIDQATSSVLYAVAFLNQLRSGPTKEAFDRLMKRNVFSYGVSDKAGGLEIKKPDGSLGLVDFAYLSKKAPEPFKSEWSAGKGINIHHKFVVTDFNLPTAKVFTGSSNLSPSGEKNNGDHLIMIEDRRIATSYAIEGLRVFDHLHFRTNMQKAESTAKADPITLRKPTAISGKPAWFEGYYAPGSQREHDRKLFAR